MDKVFESNCCTSSQKYFRESIVITKINLEFPVGIPRFGVHTNNVVLQIVFLYVRSSDPPLAPKITLKCLKICSMHLFFDLRKCKRNYLRKFETQPVLWSKSFKNYYFM